MNALVCKCPYTNFNNFLARLHLSKEENYKTGLNSPQLLLRSVWYSFHTLDSIP